MIEELKRNIAIIEENTIPILELRREKNIIPGEDTWQNRAINDIEMYRQQLAYTEILSEENSGSRCGWFSNTEAIRIM